jgi:hypothetical protein
VDADCRMTRCFTHDDGHVGSNRVWGIID